MRRGYDLIMKSSTSSKGLEYLWEDYLTAEINQALRETWLELLEDSVSAKESLVLLARKLFLERGLPEVMLDPAWVGGEAAWQHPKRRGRPRKNAST